MDDLISRKALLEVVDGFRKKLRPFHFTHAALTLLRFAISNAPAVDAVEVVRCCDCVFWKPPYMIDEEGNEKPWDGHISFCEESESGVYVDAKCKHQANTAYRSTDIAYRKPNDYCSYGKRKETT